MVSCGITDGGDEEVEELYLEEATWLEFFNRLGMSYTCCSSGKPVSSHAEIRRLQEDDDSELKTQLDLFTTSYRNSRRTWPVLEEGSMKRRSSSRMRVTKSRLPKSAQKKRPQKSEYICDRVYWLGKPLYNSH
jgi:hypothetical protein